MYRDTLRKGNGLWDHITGGQGVSDERPWATGNAWAVAGMLRVWATIKWSPYASELSSQMKDLEGWIHEIFTATQGYIVSVTDCVLFFLADEVTRRVRVYFTTTSPTLHRSWIPLAQRYSQQQACKCIPPHERDVIG